MATRHASRSSATPTRSSSRSPTTTSTPTTGALRSPRSSAPPSSGSRPWKGSGKRRSRSWIRLSLSPPRAPSECARWSPAATTGASPASAPGACPSRASTTRTRRNRSWIRRRSSTSPRLSAPRVPTRGGSWTSSTSSPTGTRTEPTPWSRVPIPWTSGSTAVRPGPVWSNPAGSSTRRTCTSRDPTSTAAGSSPHSSPASPRRVGLRMRRYSRTALSSTRRVTRCPSPWVTSSTPS